MVSPQKNKVVNIGTSLILVVFIILAMVTFAALSAVASSADYRASEITASRTAAAYAASAKAEARLRDIHDILAQAYKENPAAYLTLCKKNLAQYEDLTLTEAQGVLLCSYTVPVSETQALLVELVITPPVDANGALYTRKTWQEIPTKDWEADTSIALIQ